MQTFAATSAVRKSISLRLILPTNGGHLTWRFHRLERQRGLVANRRVSSLPVVKHFHVVEQADPGIVAGLVVAVHDQFGLERMKEALHGRIVPTITLATHALPDAMAVDDFPVASGGVR